MIIEQSGSGTAPWRTLCQAQGSEAGHVLLSSLLCNLFMREEEWMSNLTANRHKLVQLRLLKARDRRGKLGQTGAELG